MENTSMSSSGSHESTPQYFRAVKLGLYVLIFVTSVLGNALVCCIILRRKKMKTVTNYFVLSLAVADLTLTCICIPFDIPVQELNYAWPYGSFMCKLLYPLQTVLLFVSIYTLTAVGLTRKRAIVHPLKRQLTRSGAKAAIAAVWACSLLPVGPQFQALQFNSIDGSCEERWNSQTIAKAYTTFIFLLQYVLPLGIILKAYLDIGRELGRRSRNGSEHLKPLQELEARKVVRMLKVVTTLFAVCVLPNNIMWLWLDYGAADKQFSYFREFLAFSNILVFANSAGNPICYAIVNEGYQQEIKQLLRVKCLRPREKTGGCIPTQLSVEVEDKKRTSTIISNV